MSALLSSEPSLTDDTSSQPGPTHEGSGISILLQKASEPADNSVHLTDQTNLLPFKKLVACFFGVALCIVVSTLDNVVVATSVPTISEAFNAGYIVSWVPSAYLLTSTSFQPLYGRFSDIFGRKAAICVAMLAFIIGNLLAGFSKTILQLIVFRGIAGAGGGGIVSMSQIVISDIVSLRDRGKYQGIMGGVIALGYTIGPIIGGALSQKVSWRWCFWISIPTALLAIAIVIFILPLKPVEGDMRRKILSVDFPGTILTLVGCALVLLPLIWGGVTFPWTSPKVLATLLAGVAVLALFCIWEWKGARLPIIPMYIFKHSTVTGVYITMFANGFVEYSSIYYLPQYFQVVMGYDPINAGIFLIPMLVSQMVVSWIAGIIVSNTGRYCNIIHSGFAIWSVACGLISTISPRSSKAKMVVYMLLAGCGAGQASPWFEKRCDQDQLIPSQTLQTTTVAAQASVPRKDMSVVTAFRNFIRLLGGTLALAVDSSILNNSLSSSLSKLSLSGSTISSIIDRPALLANPTALGISSAVANQVLNDGYRKGFRAVFLVNASITAVATVASALLIKHKELRRADEEKPNQADEKEVNQGMNGFITHGDEEAIRIRGRGSEEPRK